MQSKNQPKSKMSCQNTEVPVLHIPEIPGLDIPEIPGLGIPECIAGRPSSNLQALPKKTSKKRGRPKGMKNKWKPSKVRHSAKRQRGDLVTVENLRGLPDLDSNVEMVGTATLDVITEGNPNESAEIGGKEIKKEPPDDYENINRKLYQCRLNEKNTQIKLNLKIGEKRGRTFDVLNVKGLPWDNRNLDRNQTVSEVCNDKDDQIVETESVISNACLFNTVNELVNGQNEFKETSDDSAAISTTSLDIGKQSQSLGNEDIDDKDVQIIEEITCSLTDVTVDIEERHPPVNGVCLIRVTQKRIPFSAISFVNSEAKIRCDLTKSSSTPLSGMVEGNDVIQNFKNIQYCIDKIPKRYYPPGANLKKCNNNLVTITAHSTSCSNERYNIDANSKSNYLTIEEIESPFEPISITPDDDGEEGMTHETPSAVLQESETLTAAGGSQETECTTPEMLQINTCQRDSSLICPACDLQLQTEQEKAVHVMRHLICYICHEVVRNVDMLRSHLLECHGVNFYYCKQCNRTLEDATKLMEHNLNEHSNLHSQNLQQPSRTQVTDHPQSVEHNLLRPPNLEQNLEHPPNLEQNLVHPPNLEQSLLHPPNLEQNLVHPPNLEQTLEHHPDVEQTLVHPPNVEQNLVHLQNADRNVIRQNLQKNLTQLKSWYQQNLVNPQMVQNFLKELDFEFVYYLRPKRGKQKKCVSVNRYKFACVKCKKKYQMQGQFLHHLRTHTFVINECAMCKRPYHGRLPYFNAPLRVHIWCDVCKLKLPDNRSKCGFASSKIRYLCSICKVFFNTLVQLERHLIKHVQPSRIKPS